MTLLLVSFLAGMLTVLAPCVLPVLPVIIGTSATSKRRATPYIVVLSLSASIILFTYLLKASTLFITIPASFWAYLSGGILVGFGLTLLFPVLWEHVPGLSKAAIGSNKILGKGFIKKSWRGDVIVGASLGPIFSTCSPTYFVILATVLPASFWLGTIYLVAYTAGLALVLLVIALIGERYMARLTVLADSRGWFKRCIGLVFVLLGLAIMSGLEKKFETTLVEGNYFDVTKIEHLLLGKVSPSEMFMEELGDTRAPQSSDAIKELTLGGEKNSGACSLLSTSTYCMSKTIAIDGETSVASKVATPSPKVSDKKDDAGRRSFVEITQPAGFVNTDGEPVTIDQYIGKKVILVSFMTYSCSNCQATFPYINAWYEKYASDGFIVIGIHTPEFAFEKDLQNVILAMQKYGVTYPVVLDNEYATWKAYGNRYWPHEYLIDIHGNIVYDHIGEGAYEATESRILEALEERKSFLGI